MCLYINIYAQTSTLKQHIGVLVHKHYLCRWSDYVPLLIVRTKCAYYCVKHIQDTACLAFDYQHISISTSACRSVLFHTMHVHTFIIV